ncbi:ubiquitin-like small modifier protein 1 [Micromonospora profundi]|uniref:MoaD/ThiS family protein n=1 Tax=Micromonospora profundi TaxID=1420889 RepID=A0AAJ6L1R4_9ACTN|nr:ubiquitin-like small modifier protein 1 [Micromonospora profundi]WLS44865.1 MoaD/ThiS family protein [Micromonospora profundi]
MVTVLLPGPLRGEAGGASRLTVDACGTLRAVLDELATAHPRLARRIRDERGELRRYVNVYVDGEDCRHSGGLATPVGEGAQVQVLPSVAGG